MKAHALKALAVVVAVGLLALAGYWFLGDGSHRVTGFGDEASPLDEPAVMDAGGKVVDLGKPIPAKSYNRVRVDFLIDGWSLRILGDRELSSNGEVLTPEPVTRADLRALLATTPDVVADVLSRTVSGAADVACDEDGCTIGGDEVDVVDLVTDPSSVPSYGAEYKGWGVKSLLYRFSVDAGDGTQDVGLTAAGYDDLTVAAVPSGGSQEPAGPFNGYYRNRYLVGAAFGHLFPVIPQWTADDAEDTARYITTFPTSAPSGGDTTARTVQHLTGLGDPWPHTAHMTPSVLTFLSSPTTGCDVGVLCTPDQVDVTVTGAVHDQQQVCATIDDVDYTNLAVFDSAVVNVTFPHPTAQMSMWGPSSIESFRGDGEGIFGGGIAPTVTGSQSMRWRTVGLVDGPDGDVRVIAGVYGPPVTSAGSLAQTLSDVSTDGSDWHVC